MVRVVAQYEYKASEPNELTFAVGDIIEVLQEDESGWYLGQLTKAPYTQGYFPYNYTKAVGPAVAAPVPAPIVRTAPAAAATTAVRPVAAATTAVSGPKYEPVRASEAADFRDRVDSESVTSTIKTASIAESKIERREVRPLIAETPKPPKDYGTAKAASPKAAAGGKFQNSNTRFRAWASAMMFGTGVLSVCLGLCGFQWSNEVVFSRDLHLIASFYAIIFGLTVMVVETFYPGTQTGDAAISYRGFAYFFCAGPLFLAEYSVMVGGMVLVCAIVFTYSSWIGEKYQPPKKSLGEFLNFKTPEFPKSQEETVAALIQKKYIDAKEENKIGEYVFLAAYFIGIAVLFFVTLDTWTDIVNSVPEENRLSKWAPWAKAFGGVLNLSCSLLVVPVSRTFIRYLYDYSNSQTSGARCLRAVLYFVPLDKSLEFHYLLAWVVLFAAFGHTICHFSNLGLRTSQAVGFFNVWSYFSGALIILCMQFMYAAVKREVKSGHFEIFWFSHHLFVAFFVLLLLHGRKGYGPNFYKYFALPGLIYILERIYRERSAYRAVPVVSITNLHNRVMIVEFDKAKAFPSGFKEGQYVFLNCPKESRGQWHPFTLSSAPQDATATVHIRIQGAGSWTRKLLEYYTLISGIDSGFARLTSRAADGSVVPGKVLGPDGTQLLRVYGPLSAPTQHISEYEIDMIVGAGIGVTPVCSCVQSIIQHRWKFYVGEAFPAHAYFYWVCSHDDLPSFRWMVRVIKQAVDVVNGMAERGELGIKTFEFHVYITSVPDVVPPEFGFEDAEENALAADPADDNDDLASTKFWGKSRGLTVARSPTLSGMSPAGVAPSDRLRPEFEEIGLYKLMLNPPDDEIVMGSYVTLHKGRPDWKAQFERVRAKHSGKEIGVAFCGNPRIGSDLKHMCKDYSSVETNTFFRLHKENF